MPLFLISLRRYETFRTEDGGARGDRQGVWPRKLPKENNRNGVCEGQQGQGDLERPSQGSH